MVAGPGIEPGTVAYETTVLPLHYPAIVLYLSHSLNRITGTSGLFCIVMLLNC